MSDSPNGSFSFDSNNNTPGQISVQIQGSKRNVKTFSIFQTELIALLNMNKVQSAAYNMGWSSLSFLIGLITQTVFSGWDSLDELAKAIIIIGVPASLIISAISFYIGNRIDKSKVKLNNIIESETEYDRQEPKQDK